MVVTDIHVTHAGKMSHNKKILRSRYFYFQTLNLKNFKLSNLLPDLATN